MTEPILKPADLIFEHTHKLLGFLIRQAEDSFIGKTQAYTNHTAGLGVEAKNVVEALWHVKQTPCGDWFNQAQNFEVWRHSGLTDLQGDRIAERAESYLGRDYGWWKLGLHLGDCFLSKLWPWGDVFFFRRWMSMESDNYPICSWVWAYSYFDYGVDFGCQPSEASPHNQHQWVRSHEEWKMIAKK